MEFMLTVNGMLFVVLREEYAINGNIADRFCGIRTNIETVKIDWIFFESDGVKLGQQQSIFSCAEIHFLGLFSANLKLYLYAVTYFVLVPTNCKPRLGCCLSSVQHK